MVLVLLMPLHALCNSIIDFFSPPTCVGCTKSSATILCSPCKKVLQSMLTMQNSVEKMPPLDALFSVFHNLRPSDLPARLVKWMKYSGTIRNALFFADFFSDYMSYSSQKIISLNKNFILCPIPLHPLRQLQRGFNQSMLIAEKFSLKSHVPLFPFLKRRTYTPTQTSFTKSLRVKNMFNVFSITDKNMVKNKSILLIDDLCTTGSTLREAAKTLKTEGASTVAAFVIGRVGLETGLT